MTAGITAGACKNDRYEGSKKLRFCNISLAAGSWMDLFSHERARRAPIVLEQGIALSQIGQEEEALKAFDKALRASRAKPGRWELELHHRILQLEDKRTLELWMSVVGSAS